MADTKDGRNPFTTPKFILSCLWLAPIAVLGVFLTVKFLWDDNKPGPDTTIAACERPATSRALSGAIDVQEWEHLGLAAYPTTVHGPAYTAEGAPRCFEHSPAGAAVAAATIASLGVNDQNRILLTELALDSQTRTNALNTLRDDLTPPTSTLRPVGVRVADYQPEAATVIVVIDTHHGLVSGSYRVVWDDGDWKWEVPREDPKGQEVINLAGFNRLDTQEG